MVLYKARMDVLTTEQAAERLGITPTRVRFFIRDGRLPARKFGRAHLINEADLRLIADRKPGRPKREMTKRTSGATEHAAHEADKSGEK